MSIRFTPDKHPLTETKKQDDVFNHVLEELNLNIGRVTVGVEYEINGPQISFDVNKDQEFEKKNYLKRNIYDTIDQQYVGILDRSVNREKI